MKCEFKVIVWVAVIAHHQYETWYHYFSRLLTFYTIVVHDSYAIMQKCWKEEPHKRPDFSKLVVTISLTLEAMAGYMNLSTTSLNIVPANKQHQVATTVMKACAGVIAVSLSLASTDKDEHQFASELRNVCDSQSKEEVEQETAE